MTKRIQQLNRFYSILGALENLHGIRLLSECDGRMSWPRRGLYFFFESGENRSDSGGGARVVRIGTHGLKTGTRSTLWKRLKQHKGTSQSGGGNHRSSIFRLIVGTAIIRRQGFSTFPSWGKGSSAPRDITQPETELEQLVSRVIGAMPFLCLPVDDAPGPDSLRGYFERNAIALLSNHGKEPLDGPSDSWLGYCCDRDLVRESGLWNQEFVREQFDPAFLDKLASHVNDLGSKE